MNIKIKVPAGALKNKAEVGAFQISVQEYVDNVLWCDYDFDYAALLRLMKYKMSRMRKRIVENNLVSDAKQIGKELFVVEEAISRLLDDNYSLPLTDAVNKKYKVQYGFIGNRFDIIERGANFDSKKYSKEIRQAYKKADKQKQVDLDLIFNTMKKKILTWWE